MLPQDEKTKEELMTKLKELLLEYGVLTSLETKLYLTEEEAEKYILFRILFTVYFLWKDIRYNKYRLVVKEFLKCTDLYKAYSNNNGKELYTYKYRII